MCVKKMVIIKNMVERSPSSTTVEPTKKPLFKQKLLPLSEREREIIFFYAASH
jgi:hypothetical protein